MKRIIITLLLLSITSYAMAQAPSADGYDSEGTRRNGTAMKEGSNAAVGLSMFGWGLALAAGIAILAAALHESDSAQSH